MAAGTAHKSMKRRARSLVALAGGGLALAIWLANLLEVSLLRPRACSLGRLQYESWLLLGRPAAMLLSLVGLVLAALARSDEPRERRLALVVGGLGVAITLAFLRRWLPGMHLPCLRD